MKTTRYNPFIGTLILLLVAVVVPAEVARTQDVEQLQHRGSATTDMLGGKIYSGKEFAVIGVSSKWAPQNGIGFGSSRVRAWGRTSAAQDALGAAVTTIFINAVEFQISSDDYRAADFVVGDVDPPHDLRTHDLPAPVYDLLNYYDIPTETIRAVVNGMTVTGVDVRGADSNSVGVTMYGEDTARMSLADAIPYDNADKQVASVSNPSSAQVRFGWSLFRPNAELANFPVDLSTRIQYRYLVPRSDGLATPVDVWSGWARRSHTTDQVGTTPPSNTTVPPSSSNLAYLGNGARVAGVSSNYGGGYDVTRLIDGQTTTSWCTTYGQTTNQFAIIELAHGSTYTINKVRLEPSAAFDQYQDDTIQRFEIQVSSTDTQPGSFRTIATGSARKLNTFVNINFPATTARYVKLVGIDNYGGGWLEATELEVYGDNQTISKNLANGGRVVAVSSDYGHNYGSSLLIDSNEETSWSTTRGNTTNQTAIIELADGNTYNISKVRLNPNAAGTSYENDSIRHFEIRVSTTDTQLTSFTTVAQGEAPLEHAFINVPFATVPAKYVMLVGVDNHGGQWLEAAELAVFEK